MFPFDDVIMESLTRIHPITLLVSINVHLWDLNNDPCPNMKSVLVKPLSKFGYDRVITSHPLWGCYYLYMPISKKYKYVCNNLNSIRVYILKIFIHSLINVMNIKLQHFTDVV